MARIKISDLKKTTSIKPDEYLELVIEKEHAHCKITVGDILSQVSELNPKLYMSYVSQKMINNFQQ